MGSCYPNSCLVFQRPWALGGCYSPGQVTIARVPLGLSYWRPLEVVGPFALGPMIIVISIREQLLLWVLGETDSSSNFCRCKALMLRLFWCKCNLSFSGGFLCWKLAPTHPYWDRGLCFSVLIFMWAAVTGCSAYCRLRVFIKWGVRLGN